MSYMRERERALLVSYRPPGQRPLMRPWGIESLCMGFEAPKINDKNLLRSKKIKASQSNMSNSWTCQP